MKRFFAMILIIVFVLSQVYFINEYLVLFRENEQLKLDVELSNSLKEVEKSKTRKAINENAELNKKVKEQEETINEF